MKAPSFTKLFDELMRERGFSPDAQKRLCWRKDGPEATAFVSLQKQSFSKGYYVNYNIAFHRLASSGKPEIDESIVDGRNPACFNTRQYVQMQEYLDNAISISSDSNAQAELVAMLDQQVAALLSLTTARALSNRLECEPPLDMYVRTRLLAEID